MGCDRIPVYIRARLESSIKKLTPHSIYDCFSGLLELERGGEKSQQSTQNNFLIFVILFGTLEVTVHETTVKLGVGASFYVPPANNYSLKNISKGKCRLSFTQVKIE